METLRTTCVAIAVALTLAAFMALVPAPAVAAESYSAATTTTSCASELFGSGGVSKSGLRVWACGHTIGTQQDNLPARSVDLWEIGAISRTSYANDAAPSPDGSFIYLPTESGVKRLVRTGDTYTADSTWKGVDPFVLNGVAYESRAYFIATDDWGDIYISNGGWLDGSPNVIVKYSAAGRVLDVFGDYGILDGQFATNMGLGVTRDGRSIYTTENSNGRVQRFDYAADGHYRFARSWGHTDSDGCTVGNFAAPYDVGIDPWGFVYVMDTSCKRVQKFTAEGTPVFVMKFPADSRMSHGIIVDRVGNVTSYTAQQHFTRTSPLPGPVPTLVPLPIPDTTLPVVTQFEVPASTTVESVSGAFTATDSSGITHMRFANELGVWGAWQAYATRYTFKLSAGAGFKAIIAQVRDAAGNESAAITKRLYFGVPIDTTPPTVSSFAVPEVTTTHSLTASLAATDNSGVTSMRIADESGTWGNWSPITATVSVTASGTRGYKAAIVQVRDAAGNESAAVTKVYLYDPPVDSQAPTIEAFSAPDTVAASAIDVTISATDNDRLASMRIDPGTGQWGAWVAYSVAVRLQLGAGYGLRTLRLQVRDVAGNVSTESRRDVSYAPAPGDRIQVVSATAPHYVLVPRVTIDLEASGPAQLTTVTVSVNGGEFQPSFMFADSFGVELTEGYGQYSIGIRVSDSRGELSDTYSLSVDYVSDTRPRVTSMSVPKTVYGRTVPMRMSVSDDHGVTGVRFKFGYGNWSGWKVQRPRMARYYTARFGPTRICIQVRDTRHQWSSGHCRRVFILPRAAS